MIGQIQPVTAHDHVNLDHLDSVVKVAQADIFLLYLILNSK